MIKNKYLILRRVFQISLMFLYFAANMWGWTFIMGNLSSSNILGTIPLSDPYAVLQMFIAGAIISTDILIGALLIMLFYSIVGGRAFCSWVCPVNIITDIANYLRRKFGFNQIQKKLISNRNMRYWIIVISLILSFGFGLAAFEFISPISIIHRGIIFGFGFAWTAILGIFLFDLFILKNGWCGHICPIGGFYSIIGRFSLFRVRYENDKCTLCMKCKDVCPENHVLFMVGKSSQQILSGECTNCARCIEVCDDDVLNFSIRDLINKKKGES